MGSAFNRYTPKTSTIVRGEVPSGLINGSNTGFTTSDDYVTGSLAVFRNGIRLKGDGDDYTETSGGFTMTTAPETGARILCDYGITVSESMAGTSSIISVEAPTGLINSSNDTFTVLGAKYASGSLKVYVNGLLQVPTTHYTETSAATGVFTFVDPPQTGDNVLCSYHIAEVGTGNADMLDGKHASDFVTLTGQQTLTNKDVPSESYHLVGVGSAPAYQNGWVNYNGGYQGAGFMKDSSGIVHLTGLVKSGTLNTIFTLPVGYRPAYRQIYCVQSGSVAARVDVVADGSVVASTNVSSAWCSLESINFLAEQ